MSEDLQNPRSPHAWAGPLISTLLTLPAAALALFFGGLSPMACDSCDGTQADRFTDSFDTAWAVLCTGLVLSLIVLVASWALPWRQRQAAPRVLLSMAAPAVVLTAYVAFTALVDWP
ncbi:hypothetical protein C5F59_021580 [Streptomyces sp. QL37]|uniref:hypothetical protein n=1 Tax=Streptomyces sp. QL37 TaxID=2093747 RepID=UPI000CF2BA71|nr:hypothetical protein [Streptomyces sp. QL37]PPQ58171.1 hypothetical protein C5F59_16910 [Streptomyces sp. QL37]